jgi:shikimate kinase
VARRPRPRGILWLVGMMGSGKSVVGRRVATRLGVPFVDTDDVVVARAGTSIARLWEEEGEAVFRDAEAAAVADLAARPDPCVVATGGGVVLSDTSVQLMTSSGLVVWLVAAPEILAGRVSGDGSRPLLASEQDPVVPLRILLAEREDRYRTAAARVVDTADRDVAGVAAEVEGLWIAS